MPGSHSVQVKFTTEVLSATCT